jgi:hypothetical protein
MSIKGELLKPSNPAEFEKNSIRSKTIALIALMLISLFISSSFVFAQANETSKRHFIIDFESIIVNNEHDPPDEQVTSWGLDAYVNEIE